VLLTQPAEGTPDVVETFEALLEASDALAAGQGPIAVDTEERPRTNAQEVSLVRLHKLFGVLQVD